MRDITFIADLGSNWIDEGDILSAIPAAKEAGATIFKLQYYDDKSLCGLSLKHIKKSKFDVEKVALACQDSQIELMISVFNEKDVPFIDRYVNRHKIASAEATHPHLLATVYATGKPVIISTGCVNETALERLSSEIDKKRTHFLYCCSEYPARNVNLDSIIHIANITECPTGYSDHCLDISQTAWSAVKHFGAHIIEKHIYARRMESPDFGHSISVSQFQSLVKRCNGIEDGPRMTMQWFVRRPMAIQHIDSWQKLEYGKNWGFYRPIDDNNYPPIDNFAFAAVYRANAMIAQHEIKAGQPIYPHNLRLVPRG